MAGEETERRINSNIPQPDPTVLTTQAVDRALAAYREVVSEQIKTLETRLHGMDRATDLLAQELVKITADFRGQRLQIREECGAANAAIRESYGLQIAAVELQITSVRDVHGEKFHAVDTQFKERDTRTDQTDKERKISLDAALAAAKEAVKEQNTASSLAIGKSEAGIKEKIDALVLLMTTSNKSLEDKIGDLKGRLDRGEGVERGTTATRQQNQLQSNWSIGSLLTIGVAVLASAIAIVIAVVNHK